MRLLAYGGVVLIAIQACTFNVPGLAPVDGGADADCVASLETCNGRDDDCDGEVDEDFNLLVDVSHCGQCGYSCPDDPSNAASNCVNGICTLLCDHRFENCDNDIANGCEASLNAAETCGDCENRCEAPTPLCTHSATTGYGCVSSCPSGTELCGASCIDTSQSTNHCGSCDNQCPAWPSSSPTCEEGRCGYLCDAGYHDCDGEETTGCEENLTSTENCGACGSPCDPNNALGSCATGTCQIVSCEADFDDCSGGVEDGCETSLLTLSDCTGCGVLCDLPHANVSCVTGECLLLDCHDGWGDCSDDEGCETPLGTEENCSACGDRCALDNAVASCVDEACQLDECNAFFDDCNERSFDGCEASLLEDIDNCGWCGNRCLPLEECISGICTHDICLDWCDCDATCTVEDACQCTSGCTCGDMVCAANCSARCSGVGTLCVLDATSVSNLDPFFCGDRATCIVDMSGSGGNLDGGERTCTGQHTSCYFNCEDTSNCLPNCLDRADCVLRCEGASNCRFDRCWTDVVSCPGDILACGTDCDSIL